MSWFSTTTDRWRDDVRTLHTADDDSPDTTTFDDDSALLKRRRLTVIRLFGLTTDDDSNLVDINVLWRRIIMFLWRGGESQPVWPHRPASPSIRTSSDEEEVRTKVASPACTSASWPLSTMLDLLLFCRALISSRSSPIFSQCCGYSRVSSFFATHVRFPMLSWLR